MLSLFVTGMTIVTGDFMAKKTAVKKQKSFEETLWDTANQLRGSIESSEYTQMKESQELDEVIRKNLEGLGYGE